MNDLHEWMQMHPALENAMPLCNCPDAYLRPYLHNNRAGLECTMCGASYAGGDDRPPRGKPTLRIVK